MTYEQILRSLDLDETMYTIKDISHEKWRSYTHGGHEFLINNPVALIIRNGGTTHRVVDVYNVSHCHPIPGNGCGLKWYNGENEAAVKF